MTAEASHKPQPLALPNCWVSAKPIGPIVITYDGPSLVDATLTLKFTGSIADQVASAVDISDEEFPNRWEITVPKFTPGDPGTTDNKVKYLFEIVYPDTTPEFLFYGTWQLTVLENFG